MNHPVKQVAGELQKHSLTTSKLGHDSTYLPSVSDKDPMIDRS